MGVLGLANCAADRRGCNRIAARLVGHPEPSFAPIAAIVGLNVTLGRRGSNAIRLLIGVVVGIAVAELVVESAGGGVWTLALATFFAMLIARAVDDQPIVVAQAAVSSVLITTFGSQGQGWERLVDALIGVGVALVFSHLLFVGARTPSHALPPSDCRRTEVLIAPPPRSSPSEALTCRHREARVVGHFDSDHCWSDRWLSLPAFDH